MGPDRTFLAANLVWRQTFAYRIRRIIEVDCIEDLQEIDDFCDVQTVDDSDYDVSDEELSDSDAEWWLYLTFFGCYS